MSAPPLDCRACGACCVADHEGDPFVHVGALDRTRLSERYLARLVDHVGRRAGGGLHNTFLPVKRDRQGNTVCAALRGTVGKRVSCGIYASRPEACADFRPGGPACLWARGQAGIED